MTKEIVLKQPVSSMLDEKLNMASFLDKKYLCSKLSLFEETNTFLGNQSLMPSLKKECFSFTSPSFNKIDDEPLMTKYLVEYFFPLIIFVGLFGNMTSLMLIRKRVRFEKEKKASFCLTTLTLINIGIILFGACREYLEITFDINIKTHSNVTCKFFFYFCYMLNAFSGYTFAFMAYERWKAVRRPFVYKCSSHKRTKQYIAGIFGFCCTITLPFLIFSHLLVNDETSADVRLRLLFLNYLKKYI